MARKKIKKTKKTNEGDFEVTVKDTTPGSMKPQTTSTVKAGSADQAIDAATNGQPTMDAEEITVKKGDTSTANVPNSQGVMANETVQLTMKAITESVSYPYSISLPQQFRKFLQETKIEYVEVGQTVMMRFDNKKKLTEALRAFRKSKSSQSNIILEGINRSLS